MPFQLHSTSSVTVKQLRITASCRQGEIRRAAQLLLGCMSPYKVKMISSWGTDSLFRQAVQFTLRALLSSGSSPYQSDPMIASLGKERRFSFPAISPHSSHRLLASAQALSKCTHSRIVASSKCTLPAGHPFRIRESLHSEIKKIHHILLICALSSEIICQLQEVVAIINSGTKALMGHGHLVQIVLPSGAFI